MEIKNYKNKKIDINKQIEGFSEVKVSFENFPRLYDGAHRVRDISIIESENKIDVQTILNSEEIIKALKNFYHREVFGEAAAL